MGSWLAKSGSASASAFRFRSVASSGGHGFGGLACFSAAAAAGFWRLRAHGGRLRARQHGGQHNRQNQRRNESSQHGVSPVSAVNGA